MIAQAATGRPMVTVMIVMIGIGIGIATVTVAAGTIVTATGMVGTVLAKKRRIEGGGLGGAALFHEDSGDMQRHRRSDAFA
ncbi:hypothetical protein [Novosphingobium sp. ZW T3_23]|uniref:hypothetical protein n=1 Tax=Novosphingobium sp. ZW T3_23 TaxID=3378084 RepID=UPI003854997B